MKQNFLLVLSLFLGINLAAQQRKFEILLIGTQHKASAKVQQDTASILTAVRLFNPDAVCVEVIPTWDTLSLRNYRQKYLLQADSIKKVNGWDDLFLQSRIASISPQLNWDNNQAPLYDSLGFYYMLAGDVYGNSNYNWFIAKRLSRNSVLQFANTKLFQVSQNFLTGSEFYDFTFPYAMANKMKYLHPVDDQTDAQAFKTYQKKTVSNLLLSIFKFNFKAFKVLRLIKQSKKQLTEAEQKGEIYEFVNTTNFQLQLAELFDNIYPVWNKSKWAKLLQQTWSKRNERIAANIVKVYKDNPALKKLVVFIGAAHLPSLKKYLLQEGNISIKVFSDYQNK